MVQSFHNFRELIMSDDTEIFQALSRVSTATITTILLKKGLRNIWMRGVAPLKPGQPRQVGRAFTLRFIPAREDLATPAAWSSPVSTRAAVEAMAPGSIVVVDAMGNTDAGIFGDILCERMARRGVRALITDGAIRDLDGVHASSLPVWARGVSAPPAIAALTFVGWDDPVGCGGVAVFPNDLIVADNDGAVVIPDALLPDVLEQGGDQEDLEAWIVSEVEKGAALPGLYPPSEETLARYQKDRGGRKV